MESRDCKSKAAQDLEIVDNQVYYFPCGSISSYQGSVELAELVELPDLLDHQESCYVQNSAEINERSLGHFDFISYDQVSIDKLRLEGSQPFEFTASFETGSKFAEIGTNVDNYKETVDELNREIAEKDLLLQKLVNEVKALEKSKKELEKDAKVCKVEIEKLNNKTKTQESEMNRLKLMIEEILDDDGSSKTSRASGFDSILSKLEVIKRKVKCERFSSPIKKDFKSKLMGIEKLKVFDVDDEIKTERPRSNLNCGVEGFEKITYKEVLRDLKEITSRASKALKNSSLNRRSSNAVPYPRMSIDRTPIEKPMKSSYRY